MTHPDDEDGIDIHPIDFGNEPPKADEPEIETEQPADDVPEIVVSEELKAHVARDERNLVAKGERIDLLRKDPTLHTVEIAAGWEQRAFEESGIDVDVSLFLLDKDDMTRVDEDFVFYNNMETCDGAIKYLGDSRTGAGEGDDEAVRIDLNGLPFDILRIMIVFSIYDEDAKGHNFSMIEDLYIRLLNVGDNNREILRYEIPEDDHASGTGFYVAMLDREGPRWHFEAIGEICEEGGLAQIATKYGIIVKEIQSTDQSL